MNPSQQRREEEKLRRREEILDAAERTFARRGFEAATMDDVAREARVSRALVYVYFSDKRGLFLGVCERALNTLRSEFEKAAAGHEPGRDQLLAIGRAYLAYADTHPCYFQALANFEATTTDPATADHATLAVMEAGRAVHAVTVGAIERGMADGSLRPDIDHPMRVAMTLWGFTHGVVQIARHKSAVIAAEGVALDDFQEGALALGIQALEQRN